MRLWTPKFVLSLAVVAVFLFDAFFLGPDPVTGHARHVVPYADTGIASFAFLLGLLYVLSHGWQWTLARLRGTPEPAEDKPSQRVPRGTRRRRR